MPVGVRRRTALRVGLALIGGIALILLAAQLLLPPLEAKAVRDKVGRYGNVKSASVSSWPAIKLLWGEADRVTVAAGTLEATPAQLLAQLWEVRGVNEVTLSAEQTIVTIPGFQGSLRLEDVHTHKQGSEIQTTLTVTQKSIDEALPAGISIEPLSTQNIGQIELRASGDLFGVQGSLTALVKPLEGTVIAEPQGFPFASLATMTLFSDPHLKVRSIAIEGIPGKPSSYRLSLRSQLT